jgi:hypothetical protein
MMFGNTYLWDRDVTFNKYWLVKFGKAHLIKTHKRGRRTSPIEMKQRKTSNMNGENKK